MNRQIHYDEITTALSSASMDTESGMQYAKELLRHNLIPESKSLLIKLARSESDSSISSELMRLLIQVGEERLVIHKMGRWSFAEGSDFAKAMALAEAYLAIFKFESSLKILSRVFDRRQELDLSESDMDRLWVLAMKAKELEGFHRGWLETKAFGGRDQKSAPWSNESHSIENRRQEIELLDKFNNSDFPINLYFQFLAENHPNIYSCLLKLPKAESRINISHAGKPTAIGKVLLPHWGLPVWCEISTVNAVPYSIFLYNIDELPTKLPPIWNYTVEYLKIHLPELYVNDPFLRIMQLNFPMLEILEINYFQFDERLLEALLSNFPPRLKHLSLFGTRFIYGTARLALTQLMKELTSLTITLGSLTPPLEGLPSFCEAVFQRMKPSKLEQLTLQNVSLISKDWNAILKWPMPELQTLKLDINDFSEIEDDFEVPDNSWIFTVTLLSFSRTGGERQIITWLLNNAPKLKLKNLSVEIEDDEDLSFETRVLSHQNYDLFDSLTISYS